MHFYYFPRFFVLFRFVFFNIFTYYYVLFFMIFYFFVDKFPFMTAGWKKAGSYFLFCPGFLMTKPLIFL